MTTSPTGTVHRDLAVWQQAAAAEEAFRHLQVTYQQAAAPALADLARGMPQATTISRFEQDLRTVIPDHADRVLADPACPP